MLEIAGRANEMLGDLAESARGKAGQLSGSLVVSALAGVATPVMPAVRDFILADPQIALEFVARMQLARQEHGAAHVAICVGAKPDMPDDVVILFRRLCFGLHAAQSYIDRAGPPDIDCLDGHCILGWVGVPRPPGSPCQLDKRQCSAPCVARTA